MSGLLLNPYLNKSMSELWRVLVGEQLEVLNLHLGLFEYECFFLRGFTVISRAGKMERMRRAAAVSAITNLLSQSAQLRLLS